jgi:hypothetical protein
MMVNLSLELDQLDLEPIMVKLMDIEEGKGWSLEFVLKAAQEYKKFLMLCKIYPDEAIVPSNIVDDFWHYHILDTQKYQEDCEYIFGYFLHHFPYFGMRGDQDSKNLAAAWQQSCALYEKHFGKIPTDLWLNSGRCPNCGRRCSNEINGKYAMDLRPRLPANETFILSAA